MIQNKNFDATTNNNKVKNIYIYLKKYFNNNES